MLFKPLPYAGNRSLVRVWRRLRPMEHTNLREQEDSHATTFALTDVCAKLPKERFDIAPLNIGTGRMGVDGLERALVLALHGQWYRNRVPRSSESVYGTHRP